MSHEIGSVIWRYTAFSFIYHPRRCKSSKKIHLRLWSSENILWIRFAKCGFIENSMVHKKLLHKKPPQPSKQNPTSLRQFSYSTWRTSCQSKYGCVGMNLVMCPCTRIEVVTFLRGTTRKPGLALGLTLRKFTHNNHRWTIVPQKLNISFFIMVLLEDVRQKSNVLL